MFGNVLIAVCTLMQIYVFWRAASVPFVRRHVPRKVLIASGLVLWVGFYLGRVVGHGGTGVLATALELFGMTWMASLFLVFVSMLATDLVTGFGFIVPRRAPRLRGWALIVGTVLSVIALVQGLRPPVIKHYEVRLAGLPSELDGTVLVALSDLHVGSLIGERWLAARVSQVQALRPDLIVLLGDLFEGHGGPRAELLADMQRLSAPLGVWAVPGNHESYGRSERNSSTIEGDNIRMLGNSWVEVRPGFVLAGVDDLTNARRGGRGDDLVGRALAKRPPGATIFLSHTPLQAEQAADMGAGLMLSGHTHGGQVWPFGHLVRVRYPLLAGRHEVGGMTVIVCRGTGTWGPRMRLWHPGEILHVTLRADRPSPRM